MNGKFTEDLKRASLLRYLLLNSCCRNCFCAFSMEMLQTCPILDDIPLQAHSVSLLIMIPLQPYMHHLFWLAATHLQCILNRIGGTPFEFVDNPSQTTQCTVTAASGVQTPPMLWPFHLFIASSTSLSLFFFFFFCNCLIHSLQASSVLTPVWISATLIIFSKFLWCHSVIFCVEEIFSSKEHYF